MPYDPNDPNQGSQAPASGTQDQSDADWQSAITQPLNNKFRQDPVIAQWLAQHDNGQGLSDTDQKALIALVGSRNPGLQTQYVSIDPSGTFHVDTPPNSFGKDLAVGAAAVFGPILAAYLIPAIAGAGGAGAGAGASAAGADAATAGGLGGVEAGAASGLGAAALPGAGTGLEASLLAAPAASGVEAGAAAGLGSATLPGAGTALDGTVAATGAAGAAGGAADAVLPSDTMVDATSVPADSLGSDLGSTLGKLGKIAGGVGSAVGKATSAAGNNALNQEQLGLTANAQNITGNTAYENSLLAAAKEDDAQRATALKNAYRASYAANPRVSPFDPVGAPKYSADYLNTLGSLASQAKAKLANPSQYDTNTLPMPKPYTDISPSGVQNATGTTPSTLQTVGNVIGPALTTAQLIAQMWGQ